MHTGIRVAKIPEINNDIQEVAMNLSKSNTRLGEQMIMLPLDKTFQTHNSFEGSIDSSSQSPVKHTRALPFIQTQTIFDSYDAKFKALEQQIQQSEMKTLRKVHNFENTLDNLKRDQNMQQVQIVDLEVFRTKIFDQMQYVQDEFIDH